MKLASEMPELISSNAHHGEHLPSIKSAIALLNAPEELQAEIKEQLAQGKTFTEAEIKAAAKQRKTLFLYRLWSFLWSIRFVFASSY
jgi:predicted Zn-dependent peptidase